MREAFSLLAHEGLIVQDAHRGVEVARFSPRDFTENCEIRFRLEPLATELAALSISEQRLDDLAVLVGKFSELPVDHQSESRTDLNNQFHEMIYEAADRPRLLELIRNLRRAGQAYVSIFTVTRSEALRKRERSEHAEILSALRSQDGKLAGEAMEEHLRRYELEIAEAVTNIAGKGDNSDLVGKADERKPDDLK